MPKDFSYIITFGNVSFSDLIMNQNFNKVFPVILFIPDGSNTLMCHFYEMVQPQRQMVFELGHQYLSLNKCMDSVIIKYH